MKKIFPTLILAFAAAALSAADIDYMDAKNWSPRKNVTFADGAITVTGKAELICRNVFAVDPAKKYTVKLTVQRTNGTKTSLVYVCFRPLDANRRWFPAEAVTAIRGTETQLTAPVKSGDQVIYVKDASKWQLKRAGGIHYNAKADYSDLPNRLNLKANPVKITKEGNAWKIELDKPVKVSLPAGLTIRQSNGGGYFNVGHKYLYSTPFNFNISLSGYDVPPATGKWWKGISYSQLQILVNWNPDAKDNTVKITNISITEE